MRCRDATKLMGVAIVTFAVCAWTAGGALAAPIDNLRAKATALEAQIATRGAAIAALGEQLNAAQLKLDDAQTKIGDAQARIAVAKAETQRVERVARRRVAAIYRRSGSGGIDILDFSTSTDANARSKYGAAASRRDNSALRQLAQARADLALERSNAEATRQVAQTDRDNLASVKAEADAAAALEASLLARVKGQLVDLVRQARAQREAAAARSAAASRAAPKAPTKWSGPVPNPSGGAAAAVAFARAQVGKPYTYAATGPDTFDCSGLTLRAWQAGGLSLPHYSGAQAALFPHVPLDGLQPGDLITSSSWSAHIGIWVGDGYIHATHTGDFIRFVAGSATVRDAVRPG